MQLSSAAEAEAERVRVSEQKLEATVCEPD